MTDALSGEIEEAIRALLADVSDAFAERYGEDLSDLKVDVTGPDPVIRGFVVVPRQLAALEAALRDWPHEAPRIEVSVLSELADSDPLLGDALVDHPGAGPVAIWSRRRGGARVTDWLPGDGPARRLPVADGRGDRLLVQLPDGTLGWVASDGVDVRPRVAGEPPVVRVLTRGAQWPVEGSAVEALCDGAIAVARKAVPYRLGGRDPNTGLDCSALVQLVVESHTGALLPRHSGDQMKVGERVGRSALRPGDLVFARMADRNILHVGLMVGPGELVHACRVDGRTRRETLDSFLSRYRFLRGQRLFRVVEDG